MSKVYDIVIIGGGPAGLTSAIYARRAGKEVVILEKNTFGGQITWSPKVENYPTIISASGSEIGDAMFNQALEQGAEAELEEVTSIEEKDGLKIVSCDSGAVFETKAVIIAAGAKPRMLGIKREEDLVGSGVCYCAVCDGAFFKGLDVAVNGGGNSALQDAVLLSEKCRKVYLIHRRDTFKGEEKLVDILKNRDNVEFVLNEKIEQLNGDDALTGITLTSGRTINVEGLFVAIGHEPQNQPFADLIDLNQKGYADSDESCITKTPGIFVAGDCRVKNVRQLTTAVADGSTAAVAACEYLDGL